MIEWVFFDAGNVLFNDDQQACFYYRRIFEAICRHQPEYTFADLLAEREELARAGKQWVAYHIARTRLPDEQTYETMLADIREELPALFDQFHLLNPGAAEILEELSQKYHLGLIANQPPECRHSLTRRDLLRYFEMVAISDELNLHKPDPAFYRHALEVAGCEPDRAVMIGDRRDNDVFPAKEVGMKAILIQWPGYEQKLWQPVTEQERLFIASMSLVPMFDGAAGPEAVQPDAIVASLWEVPAAVAGLHQPRTDA